MVTAVTGYDGSRDSASDIEIVITTSNQSEIDINIIEGEQGIIPGAVTPITTVTSIKSGNHDKIDKNLKKIKN